MSSVCCSSIPPCRQALEYIQGMRDEIDRFRFEWDDKVFRLGVSIGVTELHSGMTDIGEILAQADTACYHAKSLGGSMIQVYEKTHPALQKISDEMQWVSAITKAFEAHRFVLYRQQKVALSPGIDARSITKSCCACEARMARSFRRASFCRLPSAMGWRRVSTAGWCATFSPISTPIRKTRPAMRSICRAAVSAIQGTAEFILEEIDRYQLRPRADQLRSHRNRRDRQPRCV